MRAFVALIPPPEALAVVAAAVAPLRAAHPALRWAPPAQWHLTAAFLGEIDEAVLPDLTARLARAAHRHPPVRLAFDGAGRFGDRVLWARVRTAPDGAPPLPRGAAPPAPGRESCVPAGRVPRSDSGRRPDGVRALVASVTAAARRSGIAVDDRPHRPHVTLARARAGTDLRPAVDALAGLAGPPWTVDALHLVRSRLGGGPGGTAVHEVVASWPLGR